MDGRRNINMNIKNIACKMTKLLDVIWLILDVIWLILAASRTTVNAYPMH